MEKVYSGRVEFEIRSAFDEAGKQAVELYGFGDLRHGMVGFRPGGEIAFTLPGHEYGRAEIVEKVEAMLH
ncbi:MAG: hypothetical protein JRG82_19205 [Deltaproteobacteria bacterium]|nr:hypothetical protein [Deltaproteobacteria bacterium]